MSLKSYCQEEINELYLNLMNSHIFNDNELTYIQKQFVFGGFIEKPDWKNKLTKFQIQDFKNRVELSFVQLPKVMTEEQKHEHIIEVFYDWWNDWLITDFDYDLADDDILSFYENNN